MKVETQNINRQFLHWHLVTSCENPQQLACSRRSDSGERYEVYFSSLSLLRTALHYLNAWNRLPNSLF